jgi:transcription antitermination factor NusG
MTAATMNDVWALASLPRAEEFLHVKRRWPMLIVMPGREQRAADFLKQAGEWVYWPNKGVLVNAGSKAKGRRRTQLCSVIPGYVFLGLPEHAATVIATQRRNDGVAWKAVHAAPGVVGYVRDKEGFPALMGDDDINIIREIEAKENLPHDPKTAHRFKVGDKVRFVADLLGQWPHGTVVKLADDGRIVVETPLLGRIVPIEVYPHQIEKL